jgi:hypothetical protein
LKKPAEVYSFNLKEKYEKGKKSSLKDAEVALSKEQASDLLKRTNLKNPSLKKKNVIIK